MATKVLLVDDDAVILAILGSGLKKEGFEIISAASGEEGLKKAQEEAPNVIILDVLLPKLDGTDVAGLLQEDYRTCHLPVIYLTGLAPQEDKFLSENISPDIIFTKPVDMPRLIQKVKEVAKNAG